MSDLPAVAQSKRRRIAVAALAVLIAVTGWLAYRDISVRHAEQSRQEMVQAAREGALSLTTLDYEHVDENVQRILDASTGSFRDDFEQRAKPFADAARKAQSKSVGTVAAAGVESDSGGEGRVLVAMTVMTSNRGVPERQPKAWRIRVTVTGTDQGFKVSQVEFVP
ncbi:MAG: mammalian cell entry protein [Mycobacterium sp.]